MFASSAHAAGNQESSNSFELSTLSSCFMDMFGLDSPAINSEVQSVALVQKIYLVYFLHF